MASMDLDQATEPPAPQQQPQQQSNADAPTPQPPPFGAKRIKNPRLPKGAVIDRRPMPRHTPSTSLSKSTKHIYVSSKTPYMSIIRRVRKQLDRPSQPSSSSSSSSTKGLPLQARIAALRVQPPSTNQASSPTTTTTTSSDPTPPGRDQVLIMGTGKAIERTLSVAAFFTRQPDCAVSLRTRTLGAVDDYVVEGSDDAGFPLPPEEWQEGSRARMVSCLEVGVRLR